MFKVTVDLFSGRPNSSCIMADASADELLRQIAKERQVASKPEGGFDGLGFRGIRIDLLNDEKPDKLPPSFTIANGVARDQKASIFLARTIVDQMMRYEKFSMDIHKITPIDKNMQRIIMSSIDQYEISIEEIKKYIKFKHKIRTGSGIRVTVKDSDCKDCKYEESKFNPDFWNLDLNVRLNNNCYNYARNWKTNTFAQPRRFTELRDTFVAIGIILLFFGIMAAIALLTGM